MNKKIAAGEHMKQLLFPNANKLSDLFESVVTVHDLSPKTWPARVRCVAEWPAELLNSSAIGGKHPKPLKLMSSCSVSGREPYMVLDVTPKPEVCEAIGKAMLKFEGYTLRFEMTVRDGAESVLVTVHYDQIIGSRWLAEIPLSELEPLYSERAGIEAIVELQAAVGIKEPEDKARAGWRSMSAHEKAQTLMAHQIVCGG